MQLQQALEDETKRRQNSEVEAAKHKQGLTCTSLELKECKKFLAKECGNNEHLKKELQQFKVSVAIQHNGNQARNAVLCLCYCS